MPSIIPTADPLTVYQSHYDPEKVLKHPDFRILSEGDSELSDQQSNIACAYNEKHEVHMIHKPTPVAGVGECVVHVRATGICG